MKTTQNACQILDLHYLLGKKWTVPLLFEFTEETISFNQLKKKTHNKINATLLSQTLKHLEKHKLIKKVEAESISYALTARGKSLLVILKQLKVWGKKNNFTIGKNCTTSSCMDCGYFISSEP